VCDHRPVNDLIALGVLITIEPLPVIGFIVVLSTDRGVRNGAAFIAGWILCLIAIVVATVAVTGGKPPSSGSTPSQAVDVLTIAIGAFLLGFAAQRRRRPPVAYRKRPAWMDRVDRMKAPSAATLGVLLQPWPIVAAGAASVAQADLSNAAQVVQLVLFVLLASSSLLTMEIYSIASPDAARAKLDSLREWLDTNRDRGLVVISGALGIWLIAKGFYQLF
jgi:threonine/homoserine/homoserine lactone efflux protein